MQWKKPLHVIQSTIPQGCRSSLVSDNLAVQLCKAQEEKVRLTSRNWQQELLQRFCQQTPKPNATGAAGEVAAAGLQETALGVAGHVEQSPESYWQLAPGVRLRMLRELCHAVLNTYIFRSVVITHSRTNAEPILVTLSTCCKVLPFKQIWLHMCDNLPM